MSEIRSIHILLRILASSSSKQLLGQSKQHYLALDTLMNTELSI
jgi:hypothetical protein